VDYRTKELSTATWPDFERLFSQGNGWDFCWCTAAQRSPDMPAAKTRTRAEASLRNRPYKRELVEQGHAHGILVYDGDEPIGWCQYGPVDELPGMADDDPPAQWRITCFVVAKSYRRRGVAGIALRAALDAIRKRGGGLVEAHPIASWTHGRTGTGEATYVQGVGPIAPAHGSFGNVSTAGTASMFEREGFTAVDVYGNSRSDRVRRLGAHGCQVLMRKEI
jgi:GNAT superfamily N-acetyltransferase